MNDTLMKITRPNLKKMLKLYQTTDFGTNNDFAKEVCKTFGVPLSFAHIIWNCFDVCYRQWFLRE